MASKRTIACSISKKVREDVVRRDRGKCIFCQTNRTIQVMHFIPRSAGGLGIEENLACGCWKCHERLDHSIDRRQMMIHFRRYLENFYPEFKDEGRKFKK